MRKALKTVLCVALVLALAVVIALRVLPPMNAPAQSAAATPTPVVTIAPTPTPCLLYTSLLQIFCAHYTGHCPIPQ